MQCNFADNPIQHEYLRTVVPSDASSHPVPTVSGSTVEEGAAKLLALAKMNQIDLADLLRLVEYSRTAKEQTDESQFCVQQKLTNELLLGQSAPLPEVQVRTEEVVDDRYWNTPYHMLPKNSWGDTPIINTMVTSPSSVFVPRYTSVPASDTSVSTHGRGASSGGAAVSLKDMTWNEPVDSDRIFAWSSRGGSKHAAFANNPSNSLSGKARSRTSTGDRREPWSHRQVSRFNTKYNHDLENVAAFEVVDKMEGDTKEVFLRHGTHISSKAASSRALADTNHHAEQMRNGRFASEGEGLTAKGGYGTFKTLGRPDVGLERHAVSDHDGVLSWADGGH
jgi:hypothetical protein